MSGNVENPLPMEFLSEISVPSDACCGACLLELNEACDEASLTFSW